MRLISGTTAVAALMALVPETLAADSAVFRDSETGFTFSQYSAPYKIGKTIAFRVAVPSGATPGQPYDAVIQVAAPNDVGWCGLAWGGRMTNDPLTVAWANGQSAVVSSRFTTQHSFPQPYTGASYEVFRTGTKSNSTHWQYTALCRGCTSFPASSSRNTTLNPNGANTFAFAYASGKPSNPSSNTSSFPVHDSYNYWSHDFASAANPDFVSLVARNSGRALEFVA
ncbi:CBD9-like protein [Delitschia confertaspora ATCC 74209]|uniref:CBD9-like protein n=1 Tax=Delitschia confertaspora ATCC 74209 TaxID=1513339 RepID=A0A9P4MR98_9PLEO|nr:CBD9-like protein [Delitschia confertaspora ATCC 74209]